MSPVNPVHPVRARENELRERAAHTVATVARRLADPGTHQTPAPATVPPTASARLDRAREGR
ncbi:hypothetical protein MTF65_17430 [Streptomyces sp. APSN-46.1]|uniref:hypothetical protein n=1 Tax=Streptomyces sp. APSN-46.1 TaxID=2929049 RepID=UPI001FB40EEC|nr:hypothetical protein [Streptomyces sp. APSN-46.1]MCJ1679088.1 hypothetical protein [Streptomyces sp. APSN-46.1]